MTKENERKFFYSFINLWLNTGYLNTRSKRNNINRVWKNSDYEKNKDNIEGNRKNDNKQSYERIFLILDVFIFTMFEIQKDSVNNFHPQVVLTSPESSEVYR